MRLGITLGDPGAGIEQQIQSVIDAENDGFDGVWFGQVFGPDVMTLIALAGQRTSRIEMGTAVVPTYPRHPFAMAQQALTTQAATNGRFVLGVGPSHHVVVENMWGLSYEKAGLHVREYLNVLLPLLREGKVAYNGERYRTTANLAVPGATPPPVLISALAPMMLRMAGAMADGTLLWMTGPKTIETHIRPSITAAASDAGRPAPRIVAALPVCVTEDVAAAREVAARAFVVYGQLPNYRRVLDREGAAGPADVAIVGSEADIERGIRAVASAGATDLSAVIFPSGADGRASVARTRAFVQSLIGRV